jgi:2-polyprenyl-6-methoxyphenol hydroxylase-like FAD-dependent oxidoreductase
MEQRSCTCAIVGGGPAGIMAAYLLARAGVDVMVLEKHPDFLRDFRGDTIHPSTIEVIAEIGLLDAFLEVPHQEVKYTEIMIGGERIRAADFTHLPTRCKFIALMPQWDFLNFLVAEARRYQGFQLMMSTEAVDLIRDAAGVVIGVKAQTGTVRSPSPSDLELRPLEIRARLVIGADGRHSRLRAAAGLVVRDLGAPMDVLWFKLAAGEEGESAVLGRIEQGQVLVMLDRGTYLQCALIIKKGSAEAVKREGLAAFRARVARLAGRDRADEIESLDDVKLLTVTVDRLEEWCRPGLLFIGDAAHAMSPAGGVGINLAIQDAVATANILTAPLRAGYVTDWMLQRVQQRREFPTRVTQFLQVSAHKALNAVFKTDGPIQAPWQLKVVDALPGRKWIMGYVVGVGIRPEYVADAERMRVPWSLHKAAVRFGAAIGAIVKTARLLRAA